MAVQDYATLAQTLYVTYFGRPGDYFGMQSFQKQLNDMKAPTDLTTLSTLTQADKAGTTALSKLVNSFNTSPEATAMYGTDTSALGVSKFVEAIYLHVLNRAPDADGWAFWVNAISSGALPRATAAAAIADGAARDTSAQGLLDAKTVVNKIAVATDFTNSLVTVAQINGYSGNDAAAAARAMLAPVDSTTNVTAYHATVVATVGAVVAGSIPGTTFTLTKGINEFTGTAGNDTFDATEDSTATVTFSNLDKLDGGAGTDTLKIVQAAVVNTTTVTGATVTNIENINITSGAGVTTNTTTWTGATALNIAAGSNVAATAAATTDITAAASSLTGVAGAVTVNGGKNVTVIAADTSTPAADSGNSILVGGTTAAAGAVKVTYTETASDDGTNAAIAGSTITVTGGTTVEVNSLAVAGAGSNAADVLTLGQIDVNGNASTTAVTVKQSAATATYNGTTQKNISIVNGAVNVTDTNAATAADTIKTVTLENFGAAIITSTVLDTLNLTAGATIAGGTVTLNKTAADTSTAATTLALNTSGSFGKISGTQADVYKTVNVTAAAATTIADIEMDALTALNVGGAGVTTFTVLTAPQNAKLATITSTGAGLTVGTELATGIAVTGGAGVETISIGATTKVIDLGAGNDVVTVSITTMGAGGAVKGGDGIDTLVANTIGSAFSGLPQFSGFETLRVAGAVAEGVHNAVGFTALELGSTAAVSSFTNVAAGVGLTVLAAPGGAHTVTLADATGLTDSFNLTFKSAGDLDLSTNGITLAGVETINITNTDTNTTAHTNKLNLTADSVKSIVVTGNAGLNLTGSTYAKVSSFDASGITGASKDAATLAVTYVSGNTTVAEAVTIKGGAGNDSLTGSATANDSIFGGDGVDTLVYNGGADVFTGGAGKDVFTVSAAGTKTAYLTIADAVAGDTINLAALGAVADKTAAQLLTAKVTLGGAATFDQYLDSAAAGSADTLSWFTFGADTYLVVDQSAGGAFVSGTDAVIKLIGVVSLGTSSITGEVVTLA